MSVVIVGGNERMANLYETICKQYGCKAKVFVKENGPLKKKLGVPDLLILFTQTVSHKMALSACKEAQRCKVPVERVTADSEKICRDRLTNKEDLLYAGNCHDFDSVDRTRHSHYQKIMQR